MRTLLCLLLATHALPLSSAFCQSDPLGTLEQYLATAPAERKPMAQIPEFQQPLSREQAEKALTHIAQDRLLQIRTDRAAEMKAREIVIDQLKMPFFFKVFGEKPANGRSLYISMHGGGGAPPRVNTQQWENQKRLYTLEEGVYLAPRAPTDTWDLWHQAHIDKFFDRLIENMIAFEEVDPNRVYLMGYSAGGDGVYQVAPRMADRLAAAAMMAGHPNETLPLGLRNLPFAIHMGELDAAYDRNKIAAKWRDQLAALQADDPQGYEHFVKLHTGKGHWMDRQDAEALPWMAKFVRQVSPTRIVWKQDDVREPRFYWLAVNAETVPDRALIIAEASNQSIEIKSCDADQLHLLLRDGMCEGKIDLDQPLRVTFAGRTVFDGKASRTVAVLIKAMTERADPSSAYSAEVEINLRSNDDTAN